MQKILRNLTRIIPLLLCTLTEEPNNQDRAKYKMKKHESVEKKQLKIPMKSMEQKTWNLKTLRNRSRKWHKNDIPRMKRKLVNRKGKNIRAWQKNKTKGNNIILSPYSTTHSGNKQNISVEKISKGLTTDGEIDILGMRLPVYHKTLLKKVNADDLKETEKQLNYSQKIILPYMKLKILEKIHK